MVIEASDGMKVPLWPSRSSQYGGGDGKAGFNKIKWEVGGGDF